SPWGSRSRRSRHHHLAPAAEHRARDSWFLRLTRARVYNNRGTFRPLARPQFTASSSADRGKSLHQPQPPCNQKSAPPAAPGRPMRKSLVGIVAVVVLFAMPAWAGTLTVVASGTKNRDVVTSRVGPSRSRSSRYGR